MPFGTFPMSFGSELAIDANVSFASKKGRVGS